MLQNYWLTYAIGSAILWGTGYAILGESSAKLPIYVINIMLGTVTALVNFIAMIYSNDLKAFELLNNLKIFLCLGAYIVLNILASYCYLFGRKKFQNSINPGIYTLVSSVYPLFTFLVSYVFLGQKNFDIFYTTLGIALISIGISILALQPK